MPQAQMAETRWNAAATRTQPHLKKMGKRKPKPKKKPRY
mgnify:CR=1